MKSRKIDSAGALVEKAEKDKKVQKLIGKKKEPAKRGRPAKKATTPPTKVEDVKNQVVDPPAPEVARVPEQGIAEEPQGSIPNKTRGITWAEADTQLKNVFANCSKIFLCLNT